LTTTAHDMNKVIETLTIEGPLQKMKVIVGVGSITAEFAE
jgi:methanogenic corrinoid protein MtbC1